MPLTLLPAPPDSRLKKLSTPLHLLQKSKYHWPTRDLAFKYETNSTKI